MYQNLNVTTSSANTEDRLLSFGYGEGSSKDYTSELPAEKEEQDEDSSTDNFEDGIGSSAGEEDRETSADRKPVKPLSVTALAEFEKAQQQAGIVYISRIPPGMRPAKVKHLMSGYGK
ncbi:RNA-binding ATPase activator esf2, partial [Ceratobasidium sp. 395]